MSAFAKRMKGMNPDEIASKVKELRQKQYLEACKESGVTPRLDKDDQPERCQQCGSPRIAYIHSEPKDLNDFKFNDDGFGTGYLPDDSVGINVGEDIEFYYCLNCGQIQGDWPITEEQTEEALGPIEDEDD